MKKVLLSASVLILLAGSACAAVWNVGATRTYTIPSQVRTLVQDGDTIYIDGGMYANDAVKWVKKDLKIIGLGTGMNRTILQYTGDIPNGKGIFVFETPGTCDNAYIENIVFDGAQVSDANGANGAGIRFQATNLMVKNCKFMNCQNGILEGNGSVTTSNVTIFDSEFYNNGYQLPNNPNYSGYEHNIYISASTDSLFVINNWFHHPRGQANSLKTRAQRSYILYNLIDEEATGYGSWELNIAQGGLNVIMGNIIIQGPAGANHGIIGYDAVTNALEDFYFVNNTVINQFAGNIKYFNIAPASGINTFKIFNNIFASVPGASNTVFTGNVPTALDSSANAFSNNYLTFGFSNPAATDYSLTAAALQAIDKGVFAGNTNTAYPLTPSFTYQPLAPLSTPRVIVNSVIDIGAYEYSGGLNISENDMLNRIAVYPNPSSGKFQLTIEDLNYAEKFHLDVYNVKGQKVATNYNISYQTSNEIDLSEAQKGLYFVNIYYKNTVQTEKIVIQ
ncbi:MAG: T9SS type A sorting domain-containing protein [Bacteroidota bacterium]